MTTHLIENDTPADSSPAATPTGLARQAANGEHVAASGREWELQVGSVRLDFETTILLLFGVQALLTSIKIGMELMN